MPRDDVVMRPMTNPLYHLIDAWISRRAISASQARTAIGELRPIAVITGGSEGIGLAFARRLAKAGYDVALVARRPEPLDAAARLIRDETRAEVITITLDLTGPDAAAAIERRLAESGRYPDILVNNAGIGTAGPFSATDVEKVHQIIDLNIRAATVLMRAFLPGMLARGRGGIINVSSLGGFAPMPYLAAHYASKAYLISLSHAVAEEVAGRGVRITCVAPGPARTAIHDRMGTQGAIYRWLLPHVGVDRIARIGYRGYRLGRRLVVPGVVNSALAVAMKVLPNRLLAPITGALFRPRR